MTPFEARPLSRPLINAYGAKRLQQKIERAPPLDRRSVSEDGSGPRTKQKIFESCASDPFDATHRFDLGSGERHSIRKMVELIAKICGADCSLLDFDSSRDRGDGSLDDVASDFPAHFQAKQNIASGLEALVANS